MHGESHSPPCETDGQGLEGQLFGDVEVESAAGVLNQLDGLAGPDRVQSLSLGPKLGKAVLVVGHIGSV